MTARGDGKFAPLPPSLSFPGSAWERTALQAPPALIVAQASRLGTRGGPTSGLLVPVPHRHVIDLRPLAPEAVVQPGHVVVLVVTLLAHLVDGVDLRVLGPELEPPRVDAPLPFLVVGVGDVRARRAVAALAAHVPQDRRLLQP